jgi:ubiquinone biosynthesis protein Coq4
MNDDIPYLLRGIQPVGTDSSVLVSSSKYLNNAELRDWTATHMLRRSGRDRPTTAEAYELNLILRKIQDYDEIELLFKAERKKNAALDAWFEERHMSTFTGDDLKQYAPDTVGGIFYNEICSKGYNIQIVPAPEKPPVRDIDYFMMRAGQTHDFEHLICGGGLDFLGELVPYYMRLTNLYEHLSVELAGELCVYGVLGSMRIMARAGLHYPHTWMTCIETMQRGIEVGRSSAPIFMFKYEDVFHLTLEEAREKLGVRNARYVDTTAQTAIFEERVKPS